MPSAVMECYNTAGQKTFEASDFLARALGIISISAAAGSGSATDAAMGTSSGTGFAIFLSTDGNLFQPAVTVAGQTINWTYGGGDASTRSSGYIVYGIR